MSCINELFSGETIREMRAAPVHPSFQRLLDSAMEATAHLGASRRVTSEADLRRHLAVSPQTANNWKKRGVSQEGALDAQRRFGMSATWIADGTGTKAVANWTPAQHLPGVLATRPVAQELSPSTFEDAPTTIAWERIVFEPLKPEFQTVMPDASMEPQVPRGARVIFITGVAPVPGDWVLCKDGDGHLYLRELRQVKPGRWEAHALNPAFLPMDSEADHLQVLAVYDGQRGRKGSV